MYRLFAVVLMRIILGELGGGGGWNQAQQRLPEEYMEDSWISSAFALMSSALIYKVNEVNAFWGDTTNR